VLERKPCPLKRLAQLIRVDTFNVEQPVVGSEVLDSELHVAPMTA
jgi:hypothetical protein